MKAALLGAVACLLVTGVARAADIPCYQWGPNNECLQQVVPVRIGPNGAPIPVGTPGVPSYATKSVGSTATMVGSPGTYRSITVQTQGTAPICYGFGLTGVAAPSNGQCASGLFLAAGATAPTYTSTVPSTQLYAASSGTVNVVEEVQP